MKSSRYGEVAVEAGEGEKVQGMGFYMSQPTIAFKVRALRTAWPPMSLLK